MNREIDSTKLIYSMLHHLAATATQIGEHESAAQQQQQQKKSIEKYNCILCVNDLNPF